MVELQNKTPTYLDGSRSNFPNDVDKIPEKRDLPPNMKPKAKRFQELVNKDTLTSTEQEELNNLTIELYEFLPTAEDWNKAFDMSIATQKHYKDNTINHVNQLKQETTDFVNEKKSEITTYTDNMKNDVTTHTATEKQKISNIADNNVKEVVNAKDEALLSIERKKDAIIEFLDGTDIGELRVDVGVMDELETKDKASLVGAVNEVNKQVSEPKYVSITSYDNVVPMPDGSTNGQVSVSVKGLTYKNLVNNPQFDDGLNNWFIGRGNCVISQNNALFGKNSIYFDSWGTRLNSDTFTLQRGKYYAMFGFYNIIEVVEDESTYSQITISIMDTDKILEKKSANVKDAKDFNRWHSLCFCFQHIESNTDVYYRFSHAGGSTPTGYFDGAMVVEITEEDYNNLTESEIMQKYSYTNNTKSTISAMRITAENEDKTEKSQAYVIAKDKDNKIVNLRSLPNGAKDEIDLDKRQCMLNTNKITLNGSENWIDFTIIDGIPRASIRNWVTDNNSVYFNDIISAIAYNDSTTITIDLRNNIPLSISSHSYLKRLELKLSSDIATLEEFKQYLQNKPITLIYQLAEPEIIPIRWTGLQGYENGTLYFDTIIPEIGVYYNSGLQTHYLDHPIASIDTLYKVDKETGLRTSLDVSKCILAEDKLSFTHPDLIDGDLVDWDYVPTTESTNGEKTITASTNMSAAVDSLLKDSQTQKENIRQANSRLDNCDNKINNQEDKINNLSTEVIEHKAEKATQTILGHVKAGKNVTIQTDGTLDVDVDAMLKFNRNPTSDDIDYDTGQLWFNTDTGNIYVLFKIDKDGSAIWRGVNNTELIYPLKIYGVRIDMNNSNPLTSVVYTDDAVNMTPAPAGGGISEWDNVYPYSEIKPCLLKSGEVQTYLNPNNLAQKADGTPADITTGDNGDVMVEFPVIYWKIWREGQYLYVKYANYKIDSTWKALAHTKGSTLKDNIYIGAFLGYELNGKLRSLSGKTVTANKTIGDFRPLAQANGGGYSQIPSFAVLMLQILYLIKYKSRDSQTALGRGFVDGNSAGIATGGTITNGIDFGETTGKQQMKFLNIEDFWGNYYYWLDGLVTDSSYNLLYSNDNFNDSGTGYEKFTTGLSTSINGYIDDVWGSTETGFIIKSKEGSTTTHFCDFGFLYSGMVAYFGGFWGDGSAAGFAQLQLVSSASYANSHIAARLFYA